jgi:hypothetical protein
LQKGIKKLVTESDLHWGLDYIVRILSSDDCSEQHRDYLRNTWFHLVFKNNKVECQTTYLHFVIKNSPALNYKLSDKDTFSYLVGMHGGLTVLEILWAYLHINKVLRSPDCSKED